MAKAEIQEVMSVDRDKLYSVITRYEDYPQFVEGCTSVQVDRSTPGKVQVTYHVSMIKDVIYTIELREDAQAGTIDWALVKSDMFKSNSGHWRLKSAGPGKTEVTYGLELEFKIPVPSLILNSLVKKSLPTMVRSFEKRAKSHGG